MSQMVSTAAGYRATLRDIFRVMGGALNTLTLNLDSFDDEVSILSLATRLRSLYFLHSFYSSFKAFDELPAALSHLKSPDLDTLHIQLGPVLQIDALELERMLSRIRALYCVKELAGVRRLVLVHCAINRFGKPISFEDLHAMATRGLPELHAQGTLQVLERGSGKVPH